jgi:hypothetical protein
MESDFSYFRRRATEEKAAALKALHLQARQSHLEMAERYDDLATEKAARHQHFALSPVDDREPDPR